MILFFFRKPQVRVFNASLDCPGPSFDFLILTFDLFSVGSKKEFRTSVFACEADRRRDAPPVFFAVIVISHTIIIIGKSKEGSY